MDDRQQQQQQLDVRVCRNDLSRIEIHEAPPHAPLRPGQVLLSMDRLALTANNITYATLGDSAGFWQFFPAPLPWGRIPAWGFADVAASRHDGIAIGERVFGLLPMSTQLVVEPDRVSAGGFADAAAHRAALFPTYNQYARMAPGMASQAEDLHAVLRPLFLTSFVLDDYLADQSFFGARTLLLSSASSKTALGTAFLLKGRAAVQVCGLTSARHRGFVASTGCFDAVYDYDELAALDLQAPVVYVDISGNAALRHAVHARFGAGLAHSLEVGATHWNVLAQPEAAPPAGVPVQRFFGPAQMRKRRGEWGAPLFHARHDAAADHFVQAAARWLAISRCNGSGQLMQAYRRVLQGEADPARAVVVSLAGMPVHEEEEETNATAEERAAISFLGPRSDTH